MTDEIPKLTEEQLARAIPANTRRRLMPGQFESGKDITALKYFVGLTGYNSLLPWGSAFTLSEKLEQGRRRPEGSAIALLRIAVRHPRIVRQNVGFKIANLNAGSLEPSLSQAFCWRSLSRAFRPERNGVSGLGGTGLVRHLDGQEMSLSEDLKLRMAPTIRRKENLDSLANYSQKPPFNEAK